MQLPNDSIGITDIISWRECARRMSYGMKRHVGVGEQEQEVATPEKAIYGATWASGYGSAIHEAIAKLEEGESPSRAVQIAFNDYGQYLEPDDVQRLRDDLDIYLARDFPNCRTVVSEDEFRVPLMRYRGRQIWFRFKLDRLYERLDAPGTYIHVDYKSSRHRKTAKQVREDLQLWAYNWAIHEYWPEVEHLHQVYDQLRYGQEPTRKTTAARKRIKEWLIAQATAILEDERWQADQLLKPKLNDWCEWCPIMESCPIVGELTDFARARIAALAPTKKVGRKTVIDLDPERLDEYVDRLPQVKQARGILKRFDEGVTQLLKDMPAERRDDLGYSVTTRSATVFTPDALEAMHSRLGDRFYDIVGITKTKIEEQFEDEPELSRWLLSLGMEADGAAVLVKQSEG